MSQLNHPERSEGSLIFDRLREISSLGLSIDTMKAYQVVANARNDNRRL